jgi:TPP-dependent pyruvate/acetoin dehydrogenase alpha subunit
MGTALERSESEPDIHRHAESYRIPAETVDGMDVIAVEVALKKAADHIRENGGPFFVESHTYRFRAHSMFDAELYREKAEVEEWKKQDPIDRFGGWLKSAGLIHDADIEAIEKSVADEIADAVEYAEAGEWEPVEDLTRDVYTPHENRGA